MYWLRLLLLVETESTNDKYSLMVAVMIPTYVAI